MYSFALWSVSFYGSVYRKLRIGENLWWMFTFTLWSVNFCESMCSKKLRKCFAPFFFMAENKCQCENMGGNWPGDGCWWIFIFPLWSAIVFMEIRAAENLEKILFHLIAENICNESSYWIYGEKFTWICSLFIVIWFKGNKWNRKPRPRNWQQRESPKRK